MARRGVGSNQYVDKASTATVDDVKDFRTLSNAVNRTPAPSASSWQAYTVLSSAYESEYRRLVEGPYVRGEATKRAKAISAAQDNVFRSHPDALGVASLKSARYEAQCKVSGERNPFKRQCDLVCQVLQGEHVDENDLTDAIADLTGIGNDDDFGKAVPAYAALMGNAGDMSVSRRAEKLDELRKGMASARAKALTKRG